MLKTTLTLLTLFSSMLIHAETHIATQKNKSFTSNSLKVKVGDSIEFKNEDTVYHNIFSLSDLATFDLGSYGPGETRKVKFDKPGTIEIECAVHKNMKMKVEVK